MPTLGELFPAKDPNTQKDRFKEKSHQRFKGQRSSENIPDEARILGPVHTELKFLDNTGHHSYRKIDNKQLTPKFCHAFINVLSCAHIQGFHNRNQDGQTKGKGNEEKVVDSGNSKLQPG